MDGATMQNKLKTFWQKPEGKTGIIALAGLIFMGVIGVAKILAFIQTTLQIGMLVAGIGTVLFIMTRPTTWVLFQLMCRKITSFIIKIDPLEILKIKVREMEENLEKVGQCLSDLRQTQSRLGRKIQENDSTVETSMQKASYAQKQGQSQQSYLEARKAGRRQKSNLSLKELFAKIETMHRVLTKIHGNSSIIIEDTKDEIQVTEEEYKAVKAAHGAMKSAMSIISGDKDKRAIYEEAYEVLSDEIANKSGELQSMLETSKSLMDNIDIEQGMLQDQGMKMLEEWEKKADNWLVGSSQKSDAVSKASGGKVTNRPLSASMEDTIEATNNQFSNLFNK